MAEPSTSSKPSKPEGYAFYRDVLGSPKHVVAPMVDQSELPWRILSRRYGAQLVYTPMINAKMYADPKHESYRTQAFNIACGEEGDPTLDRPLIIQFCANDPDKLLASAKALEGHCDAVDINLGCPQDIAKKGKYGAFLMDDWDLIYRLINILHKNLSIPVTAKFRVFPTVEKTVEYAKMLESAGAQLLTCHGRLREQRGQNSGLADWAKIRAVKEAVSVPVFANGNILYTSDIERCLQETGADGVMSAEGQLYNAAIFASAASSDSEEARLAQEHPSHADLALEYLDIVKSLKTRTSVSAVKGHLFKLLKPALSKATDLRDKLGKVKVPRDGDASQGSLQPYVDICLEFKERMDRDRLESGNAPVHELIRVDEVTGLKTIPHWFAQSYVRPPPPVMPSKKTVPAKRSLDTEAAPLEHEEKKLKLEPSVLGSLGTVPVAIV